jgi:two-component system cell cycle response regulator
MAKDKLFQDILDLLEEDKKTQEWLLEKIRSIMKQNGDRVFSNLLKVFTHLELEPQDAEKVWNEIIAHQHGLSETIGRPVGLRVAMLDYFISVNKQMRNPKIIEIEIFEKLEKSLITDDLTGLYNKRFFHEAFYREVQRAKRYGTALSLMFVDIDDFKKCNELKGHPFGDNVLKQVASIIEAGMREVDYPCRFGGDEFVVILPETRGTKAVIAAERLQEAVAETQFHPDEDFPLTVSAGIASYGIDGTSPDMIIENADTALRRAKNDGKNRVYIYYKEKREFARINTDWEIKYRIIEESEVNIARMKNVGGGGLLFENEDPIPISSILDITFFSPFGRKKIEAQAKVVRLEVREDGKFDVGIFFTKIDPNNQKEIIKFAEQEEE